jgi:ADP-heptose:LPS heptosyltransferase
MAHFTKQSSLPEDHSPRDLFQPGLLERLPRPPRKVVLLRASRIGDFLCAIPAIRALRASLPEAEISMITLPLLQDLARRSPHLDRVFSFPGFPGIAEQLFEARAVLPFLRHMQDEEFDLAIQMQGTGVYSNPFMLLLGAQATAGFVRPDDQPGLLTTAFPYPHALHEIHCVQALTNFLGAPARGEELEFPLWPTDHEAAATLLDGLPPPWIGLHPSSRDAARRWPLECFSALAQRLLAHYGGTLFLLGDREAQPISRSLEQQWKGHVVNLTGQTSLPVLGALIARLAVLVTNDSGPAHIAYALQTPTVTLFGDAKSTRTNGPLCQGPFRSLLAPLVEDGERTSYPSQRRFPIETITVSQVLGAIAEIIRPDRCFC